MTHMHCTLVNKIILWAALFHSIERSEYKTQVFRYFFSVNYALTMNLIYLDYTTLAVYLIILRLDQVYLLLFEWMKPMGAMTDGCMYKEFLYIYISSCWLETKNIFGHESMRYITIRLCVSNTIYKIYEWIGLLQRLLTCNLSLSSTE